MSNHIDIDFSEAYDTYNGKRVLFFRMVCDKPVLTEGKFLVGGNSKWMQIDWVVSITLGKQVTEHIPVSQEILGGIQSAPQGCVDSRGQVVSFVIQKPILAVYSS
jgi:hypothetical protein